MKKIILLLALFVTSISFAQLDPAYFPDGVKGKFIVSDTLSTAQRDALTPEIGTIIYHKDTGVSQLENYNGAAWTNFAGSSTYTPLSEFTVSQKVSSIFGLAPTAGNVIFEFAGTDVTSILFNEGYSTYLVEFENKVFTHNLYITVFNKTKGISLIGNIIGFNPNDVGGTDYYSASINLGDILAADIDVNDEIEVFISVSDKGSAFDPSVSQTITAPWIFNSANDNNIYSINNDNTEGGAFFVQNSNIGSGLYVNNTSSGNGVVLNGSVASTGNLFEGRNSGVNTTTINKEGDIVANSFTGDGSGLTNLPSSGDVSTASNFTAANKLVVTNSTDKTVKESLVEVSDIGAVTFPENLTITNTTSKEIQITNTTTSAVSVLKPEGIAVAGSGFNISSLRVDGTGAYIGLDKGLFNQLKIRSLIDGGNVGAPKDITISIPNLTANDTFVFQSGLDAAIAGVTVSPLTTTTTVIDLSNTIGNYVYATTATTADAFTLTGVVTGGKAMVLIDTTGDTVFPTLTGSTQINSAPFEADVEYYMMVENNGNRTEHYFVKRDIGTPIIFDDFVDKTITNTYTAGAKQIFQSDATSSGMGFTGVTADPSTTVNGDLWYRSSAGEYRYNDGGVVRKFVSDSKTQTLSAKTLISPVLNTPTISNPVFSTEIDLGAHSLGATAQTVTGDGTTTIDWGNGNFFHFQFGAFNEVFTFTAPTKPGTFILKLVQDGTGSRTVTFPATVKWSKGTAPTLTTTATTGTDIITFYFDGTNYFAVEVLDFQ